jgi:uncharacterized protein YycO
MRAWLSSFADELEKIAETEKVEAAKQRAVANVQRLKKSLKPGDILFTAPIREKMQSTFGKYFYKPISKAVQGTDFGHAAMYVGDGQVVEARMGETTKAVSLASVAKKQQIVAMRPNVTPKERREAIAYVESQKGKPFSMTALANTLNPFRGKRKGRKPEEADALICSALVANAYARRKFSDAPRVVTTPAEVMRSPHLVPVAALVTDKTLEG